MKKLKTWLENNKIDFTVLYTYEVDDKQLKLSLDQVLAGVLEKVRSEDAVIEALDDINKFYAKNTYLKVQDKENERINEIENFLREMAIHVVYKNKRDFTWEELASNNEFSVEFLKWLMKEKNITEAQMLCDHDDTETYDHKGTFYNSVGECKKCNCSSDNYLDDENLELVWKAWNRNS
jgi:arsenate reductase-like glutaredoxin family protein